MFSVGLIVLLVAVINLTNVLALPQGAAVEVLSTSRATDEANGNLTKRYDYSSHIFCGCGFGMNQQHTDTAVQNMKNQLYHFNGNIPSTETMSSEEYDVVAFICNSGLGPATITADNYGGFLAEITKACGHYVAGTYSEADFNPPNAEIAHFTAGYMRWVPELDFCAEATTSPASSC